MDTYTLDQDLHLQTRNRRAEIAIYEQLDRNRPRINSVLGRSRTTDRLTWIENSDVFLHLIEAFDRLEDELDDESKDEDQDNNDNHDYCQPSVRPKKKCDRNRKNVHAFESLISTRRIMNGCP